MPPDEAAPASDDSQATSPLVPDSETGQSDDTTAAASTGRRRDIAAMVARVTKDPGTVDDAPESSKPQSSMDNHPQGASARPEADNAASQPPQAAPSRPAPDPLAEQVAALMRRDRAQRDRDADLKTREAKVAELEARVKAWQANPIEAFEAHGGSLASYQEAKLGEAVDAEAHRVAKLEKELAEQRQWREKFVAEQQSREKAAAEEKKHAEYQRIKTAYQKDIADFIDKNPKYKLLKVAGLEGEVYRVIEEHATRTLDETGQARVLDYDEASAYVMQARAPQLKERIKALLDLDDFVDLRGTAPPQGKPSQPAKPSAKPAPNGQKPRLTNDVHNEPARRRGASKPAREDFLAAWLPHLMKPDN